MKKLLIFVAIVSALLTSCKKGEELSVLPTAQHELGVSASISGTVNTRAYKDNPFISGDKVSVFITGGSGSTAYTPKIAQYTFNGTSWISPTDDASKIFLSNVAGSVYGFYPTTATVSTGTLGNAAKIDIVQSATENSFTGDNQTDYMYAAPTYKVGQGVSNATNAEQVDLNFKHALSKVTFVVNQGQYYTGAGSLTMVKLTKATSFNVGTGAMAATDGTLTWSGVKVDNITFTGNTPINSYKEIASTTPVVTGLIAPRSDNSNTTLTLTIDNKEMYITLPINAVSPNVGSKWDAGNNYRYTIIVNGTGLAVTNVSITDWQNNEVGSVIVH
jgi:hypothetical protein